MAAAAAASGRAGAATRRSCPRAPRPRTGVRPRRADRRGATAPPCPAPGRAPPPPGPGPQLGLLLGRRQRRTAGAGPRAQAGNTALIVAVDPVPQGLPIHAAPLGCPLSRHTLQDQRDRQQPPYLGRLLTRTGRRAQLRRRELAPGHRHCRTHAALPGEATPGSSNQPASARERHRRVSLKPGWYESVGPDAQRVRSGGRQHQRTPLRGSASIRSRCRRHEGHRAEQGRSAAPVSPSVVSDPRPGAIPPSRGT
jgi:hypothetical protein